MINKQRMCVYDYVPLTMVYTILIVDLIIVIDTGGWLETAR